MLVLAALAFVPAAAASSPDFQLLVSPSSQQLQPGSSVSFAIQIGSIDGFSAPVDLSVSGLPSGMNVLNYVENGRLIVDALRRPALPFRGNGLSGRESFLNRRQL